MEFAAAKDELRTQYQKVGFTLVDEIAYATGRGRARLVSARGRNKSVKQPHSDVDPVPRPEDFPLSSPESRAAARAMLEGLGQDDILVFVATCVACGDTLNGERLCSCERPRRE